MLPAGCCEIRRKQKKGVGEAFLIQRLFLFSLFSWFCFFVPILQAKKNGCILFVGLWIQGVLLGEGKGLKTPNPYILTEAT